MRYNKYWRMLGLELLIYPGGGYIAHGKSDSHIYWTTSPPLFSERYWYSLPILHLGKLRIFIRLKGG